MWTIELIKKDKLFQILVPCLITWGFQALIQKYEFLVDEVSNLFDYAFLLVILYGFYERISSQFCLNFLTKFSEKLTFLTPWYAHERLRIRR